MNTSDYGAMQNLGALWYQAAKDQIDTSGRMKLYDDTEKTVQFLTRSAESTDSAQMQEIVNLCDAIIKGFSPADGLESETLAEWVAQNTGLAEKTEFNGAYPVLHHLFETIGYLKNTQVDPAEIDSKTLKLIKEQKGPDEYLKEIGKIQYSQTSSTDLLKMCKTSHKDREIAMDLLVERLNRREVRLSDLRFNKIDDVEDFFKDKCSQIRTLNLLNFNDIQDADTKKISEIFPNLEQLFLINAEITNQSVHFFETMKSLKNLYLSSCHEISDLSFLKSCSKLTHLTLEDCSIVGDTSFLQYCPSITSLNLSYSSQIKDFSSLKNCPLLTNINLTNCSEIKDLNFLENCKMLTSLNLSGCNQIKDLTLLENFKELTSLNLSDCNANIDLSFLKNCPSIESLNLSNCNQIKDLNFLENCKELRELELDNCIEINDFSILKTFPYLTHLSLTGCHQLSAIKDLSFLERNSFTTLNLGGSGISDISFLKKCPFLKKLFLSGGDLIKDFSFLENCRLLTDLGLSNCKNLEDIRFLEKCPDLATLNLAGCTLIKDFSLLENCRSLKMVVLNQNQDSERKLTDSLSKKGIKVLLIRQMR